MPGSKIDGFGDSRINVGGEEWKKEAGQDASGTVEVVLKGREIKVPSQEYLRKLVAQKLGFGELKAKLERDFPGYALPNQEDMAFLKLAEEHEGLKKLTGGTMPAGISFNIFTCTDGKFDRSHWSVSDSGAGQSFDNQYLKEEEKDWPHLRIDDFVFLVKKTLS